MIAAVPRIDVVILTWNDGEVLHQAVDSALSSSGVDVTVTVVDNGSEQPVALPHDDRVTLIRNPTNRGVAAARNQGVRAGAAPFVCLLDSDARLADTTLRALCQLLADDPTIGLSAPVFDGQHPRASAGRMPGFARKAMRAAGITTRYAAPRRHPAESHDQHDVDFAIGACQVFPRSVFEAVGGIDESFFYGPEDLDFCARIRRLGHRIVQAPTVTCHHPARRRHRRVFTRAGARHGLAVLRFLYRARVAQ